jgi:hypothetical protein
MQIDKNIVLTSTNRNLLVYDADADRGECTQKLILLMSKVYADYCCGDSIYPVNITTIYIPIDSKYDIQEWKKWDKNDPIFQEVDVDNELVAFGMNIVFYDNVDEVNQYFKSIHGTTPDNDPFLVFASSDNQEYLIGSY